jgi:hypothetical protein
MLLARIWQSIAQGRLQITGSAGDVKDRADLPSL